MAKAETATGIASEIVTNIFEALEFENAEEEMVLCDLAGRIFRIGRERGLPDDALAELADCPLERMALLHAVEFDDFTIDELCRYLVNLGHSVQIVIESTAKAEAHLSVVG